MEQMHATHIAAAREMMIARSLARLMGDIAGASDLAKTAIHELGGIHSRGAEVLALTLDQAFQMMAEAEAAGRLTPLKRAALHHRTLSYLYEMLAISDDAGTTIGNILNALTI